LDAPTLKPPKNKADAFVELLRPLQKPLEIYCQRMLRDRTLVEDVLQTAVAAAFAQFEAPDLIVNFKAWMFRFVTLTIFNCNRKHDPVSLGEVPEELAANESWDLVTMENTFATVLENPDAVFEHFDDVVVDALKRLTPYERAVILLRAIGGFNYKEIHELLSIPLGSVIGYLSRARNRLRIALMEYAAERDLFRRGALPGGPQP
jgi:RNA polymerase sigma-70 factor (ECF subfamily)